MTFLPRERDIRAAATPWSGDLKRLLAQLAIGTTVGGVPEAAMADPDDAPKEAAAAAAPQTGGLLTVPLTSSGAVRDYGPSRPGMGTTPATVDPGRVSVEIGLADWQRDEQPGVVADSLLIGATTVRVGITGNTELFGSFVPFGHIRVRDTTTGEVDQADRVGDAAIGFKHHFRHPDGSGLSFAAQPFVVLPVGRDPVGAGDWGAGMVLPASLAVSGTVSLQLTPEIDAATNGSGHGRHFAYSVVGGLGIQVAKPVQVTFELSAQRDLDPDGYSTRLLGGAAIAWKVGDNLQLDAGATVGLNHDTPDHRVYAGVSRRF